MEETNVNHVDNFIKRLDEYIKNIANTEGYISYEIEHKNLSPKGGSFMGLLYEVNISGKTKDGIKKTSIFMKHIMKSYITLIYNIPDIFKRENFVYSNLFKELSDLQNIHEIPITDRFKVANVFKECNDNTIILENLMARGFKTYYRMDIINLEYAKLAVKDLARLHGISMAMEIKRPDYFENNIKNMNCLYIFDDNWKGFTHNMYKFAVKFLEQDVKEKINNKLVTIVDNYPNYMNDPSCKKTICHGDFRHNNIMVKEIDGKPTEVIAVDFQITHFGNPVLDFIYFIFWGTDQEFRKLHLEQLKELYYQHLGCFLKYFDINVEEVFPKDIFETQYRSKLDFGLMISVFYLPFLFPPEDDVPNLSETKDSLDKMDINVDKEYGERFRGIVEDFIKWGYFE